MEKLCKEGTTLEEFEKAISSNQVDVNEIFGSEKKAALIWAVMNGYYSIVSLLIEKGASMDIKDKFGELVLYIYKLFCNPYVI